jgi:alpha-D-ribose 1-methylphosphonate 5-triphosphate diphosphatase
MMGKHGMSEATFAEHVATRQALGDRVREAHERAAVDAAQRFGAVLASHDDTTAGHVARSAATASRWRSFRRRKRPRAPAASTGSP